MQSSYKGFHFVAIRYKCFFVGISNLVECGYLHKGASHHLKQRNIFPCFHENAPTLIFNCLYCVPIIQFPDYRTIVRTKEIYICLPLHNIFVLNHQEIRFATFVLSHAFLFLKLKMALLGDSAWQIVF